MPSRVLLDEPYPDGLPVVPACAPCNASFSLDEEYLACLVDCVLAGSVDDENGRRPKIARILRESPALRSMLNGARQVRDRSVSFSVDNERVRSVLLKLARGHAMYELDTPLSLDSVSVAWIPIPLMTSESRDHFETPPSSSFWPEVGCRWMQRTTVMSVTLASKTNPEETIVQQMLVTPGWIEVQPGRYRYLAGMDDSAGVVVRMVLSEYLACEVVADFE